MRRIEHATRLMVGLLALALPLAGCGGDESECTPHDYTGFDGANPPTHFRADVQPILQGSCALSSCHADAAEDPYLGPANLTPSDAQITQILTAMISHPSKGSNLKIVEQGSPQKSFLMHKVDSDFNCVSEVTCSSIGCGAEMPKDTGLLADDKRNAIRRWISQGAKDD